MSKNSLGFTLLEIVIAIAILSFLSIFTVQSIQRALQTKAKVQSQIDKSSTLRDALHVMERDINMAFNYHDPYIELYNLAQQQRQKAASTPAAQQQQPGTNTGAPGTPQTQVTPPVMQNDPDRFKQKTEKIYTQFIGEPQSLTLTTLSNVRMMEDSPISSQAEVGYSLKACRRRSNQEQSSQCLWRRVANYIHDDITRDDGQSTVLLENVSEFKLRYLGPGREEEWVDTWITTERGDDQTKNKFPYAVEITLAIKDSSGKNKDKELRMTTVAAVRNPNNPTNNNDPKDPANANQQQPQGINADQAPDQPQQAPVNANPAVPQNTLSK